MGNFDDDFFSGSGSNGNDGFGDFGEEDNGAAASSRRPRRRASVTASSVPSSSRSRSSDRPSGSSSGSSSSSRPSSRRVTSSSSSQSLDEQMEAPSSRSTTGTSSVRRPTSRRASIATGGSSGAPSSSRVSSRSSREDRPSRDEVDYGYGSDDAGPSSVEDFGYGDAEPSSAAPPPSASEQPARARRQRRCSIADVVNTASIQPSNHMSSNASACSGGSDDYGYGDATPDSSCPAPASRGLSHAAPSQRKVANASIANLAIPMADEPKKAGGMGRRGSIAMMGMGVGRKKEEKVVEVAPTKKPGADRDRHRQGTLLDRVGASSGDKANGRNGTGSSYSDRIMSK